MKRTAKRPWTRGEKWLWVAPLLFVVGASAALLGPVVLRQARGLPVAILRVPPGQTGILESLVISADGSTLAVAGGSWVRQAGNWGGLYFWDARTLRPDARWNAARNAPLKGDGSDTRNLALAISPDAKSLAFSRQSVYGKAIPFSLFDLSSARFRWQIQDKKFSSPASYARFSHDGKRIGVGLEAPGGAIEFRILRVADGHILSRWSVAQGEHSFGRARFAWAPDDKTIVIRGFAPLVPGEKDPEKARYALETRRASDGKLLRSDATRALVALDLSADGRRLSTVTATQILPGGFAYFQVGVRDAQTGNPLWTSKDDSNAPNYSDAEFSPDGKTVAVFGGDKIELRDAQTGAVQRALRLSQPHSGFTFSDALAWSPDGKRLFARGDNTVEVWDLN